METTEVQTPEGPRIAIYLTVAEARELLRGMSPDEYASSATSRAVALDLMRFTRDDR